MHRKFDVGKILLLVLLPFALLARDYPSISSWTNPTENDLVTLQEYLQELSKYDETLSSEKVYGFRKNRVKNINIMNDGILPPKQLEYFQSAKDDRSCLIVTYASFNENYIQLVNSLKRTLKKVGYKGHFLYWKGGWPYLQEGGLKLFDTPYGFKICALLEARAMGYEKILWLDSRIQVLRNPQPLFDRLDHEPVVMRKSLFTNLKRFGNDHLYEALNTSEKELSNTIHYATGILGLNLQDRRVNKLLDTYYEMAKNREGFISKFPCQVPWSLAVKRTGIKIKKDQPLLLTLNRNKHKNAFFLIDYRYKGIPDTLSEEDN